MPGAGWMKAIVAPCGSTMAAKRPTFGTSIAGMQTLPPSLVALAAVASQSSTPTYGTPWPALGAGGECGVVALVDIGHRDVGDPAGRAAALRRGESADAVGSVVDHVVGLVAHRRGLHVPAEQRLVEGARFRDVGRGQLEP